jgi:hypothetical protein
MVLVHELGAKAYVLSLIPQCPLSHIQLACNMFLPIVCCPYVHASAGEGCRASQHRKHMTTRVMVAYSRKWLASWVDTQIAGLLETFEVSDTSSIDSA